MRNLTPKKIGTISFSLLMIVAAVVTITGFALDWWPRVFRYNQTIADPAFATRPETAPQPVPETPTPTAAASSTAKSMLKTALSIPLVSERSKGLRTVATIAVIEFDYETAIAAGRATPSVTERGKTLSFVARCAAQDGLFDKADEAVRSIPSISVRSKITNEILDMSYHQDVLGISPSPGRSGWVNCR